MSQSINSAPFDRAADPPAVEDDYNRSRSRRTKSKAHAVIHELKETRKKWNQHVLLPIHQKKVRC